MDNINSKQERENMIANLNVTEDIKEKLLSIERVASSENIKVKASVKHLFINSPSCKELSKIAKCYEKIITNNKVYPVRGLRTYLELAFPATGKEKDYKEFFASPRLAAATQDYFTGVFLISFEQWKSAKELLQDSSFSNLIKFIDANKCHISFVFHVTPEFKDISFLYHELSKHVNLYLLEHSYPDINMAVKYIETQLIDSGIKLDPSGRHEIQKLVEEKIDVSSTAYHGYQTLEQFVAGLQFELYAYIMQKQAGGEYKNADFVIGEDEVRRIVQNFEMPDEPIVYERKLGFI